MQASTIANAVSIPSPTVTVRPGARQSGFMVQGEMEARFPVEANTLFQLLSHKENIFSGVVGVSRKPTEVAPAVKVDDPRFKVYEEVVLTSEGQKPNSLRMLVEEDTRNPQAMMRRSNLLQGDQLERMESRWTVMPAEGGDGRTSIVRLEQGMTPKGVPSMIRPLVNGFLRGATEKAMRQNHADLSATVQQVLAGASVDEAAAAARASYKRNK